MSEKEFNIFGRHSIRSDGKAGLGKLETGDSSSEEFPSLTKKGEEKARETARKDYVKVIEKMDPDGILFLGGSSEEERTKATAEIIGDELQNVFGNREDVVVFDRAAIENLRKQAKQSKKKVLEEIKRLLHAHDQKKIIITYPLFLKEFSLRPAFRDSKTGEHIPYAKELLTQVDYDEQKGLIEWLENLGKIEKNGETLETVSAQETAEAHLGGLHRLRSFAQELAGERQVNIGIVGHGWNVDALALYYANKGQVDRDALQTLFEDKDLQQAETGWVEISPEKIVLHYKDKEFST